MTGLAVGIIVAVIVFSILEIKRWNQQDFDGMLTTTQKTRRIIGLCMLLVLGIMAYFGSIFWINPILEPKVMQSLEMLYWLVFALIMVFVPFIAFLEFKDSMIRASELRRDTYRQIVTAPLENLPNDDTSKKNSP
jgi:uncharacterized membrane protein YkvI